MSFRITTRKRLGPVVLNFGTKGVSSVALALGPVRYRVWSRTGSPQGVTSVNLPGPVSYRPSQRRNG